MQSSSNEQLNELKTQLVTREGTYQLVSHAEYSRPKATTYAPNNGIGAGAPNSTPVRISFAKVHCSDVINSSPNAAGGLGNPFLPTTHYNRLSHSSEGLNVMHSSSTGAAGPATANMGTNTTASTTIASSNNSSSPSTYLNHHSEASEHSRLNRTSSHSNGDTRLDERIIFNIGREVFIFAFNGLQPADLTKLVDRRNYKTSSPTCHDIFVNADIRIALLLIGFNTGQIQFVDLYRSEVTRFFNSERLIEKTKVTCVRWLPRSKSNFLVSFSSGQMYLFKEDLTCGTTAPNYQQFKSGEGFTIYTCKTKSTRNPIFRWSIGEGAIHEFAFSPCGEFLATVSQDGFLRVFHYDRMELLGRMRSYFGGLLCVGWSPDSKFIVTGGEDDLITIWSHTERRVIARGQGHKSWVNVVTFDPYMTDYNTSDPMDDLDDINDDDHSLEDGIGGEHHRSFQRNFHSSRPPRHHDSNKVLYKSKSVSNEFSITSYRIGSVGQDTQICLWDLTDDVIRQSSQQPVKSRASLANANASSMNNLLNSSSTHVSSAASGDSTSSHHTPSAGTKHHHQTNGLLSNASNSTNHHSHHNHHHNSAHQFFNSLIKSSKSEKSEKSSEHKHHKSFSLSSRSFSDKHKSNSVASTGYASGQVMLTNCTGSLGSNHYQNHGSSSTVCDPGRLLGTPLCPRLDDVPMLEPHVCKKVAHERLTELIFCKDYIAIANQDGKVSLFARPNYSTKMKMPNSPNASIASDMNDIACDDNSAIV